MKSLRFPFLFTLFILGSFLLSACTGGALVRSWPGMAASQDTIYLADAGQVYVLNAANGTISCRFPEKGDNAKPFYAAPAVTDNLIVAGNYGHTLYGFGKDCQQKWTFVTDNGNFAGTPLVIQDTVLAPSTNNKVYALSAVDGKELWSFETKNAVWAAPASDGKIVYQPALDHYLYALNLADGKQVWKKDLGSALISAPLLTQDGTLYLTDMQGEVVAVKATDGSVIWRTDTGGRLWSTPVLHDNILFVGNASGKATAVSMPDGKIAWQKDLGSPIFAGGALLSDSVVFVTEGGAVVALSFDGQKEMWRQTISGKLYTTPVVTGQTLTVAVLEGDKLAQAYNVNGQVSWPFVAPK
jgi:outer membrane protein assembly factor BamB